MAEPHDIADRAPGLPPPEQPLSSVPGPNPLGRAPRPLPPDPVDAPDQAYRALSVLALAGFGVSALYAAVVLLLGLVALVNREPMPDLGATLVLPVTALLVCLLARFRIGRSEGTLAGGALAGWGAILSLIVCLGYPAYSLGVYLALKQQSEAFTNEWLDLLRRRETERAAWRTMPPRQRSGIREDDPNLSAKLEDRLGNELKTSSGSMGILSQFRRAEFIRTITQSGSETTFEFKGLKSWEYKPGGYRVVLSYRITTPECWFDILIAAEGTDSPRAGEGRQWYIDMPKTTLEGEITLTEAGQALEARVRGAYAVMTNWESAMKDPTSIDVYLLSLPADQREAARRVLNRRERLGAVAGGWASCQDHPDFVAGYQRACRGEFVEAAAEHFPDEKSRKDVTDAMREYFEPGMKERKRVSLEFGKQRPTLREKDGVLQVGFDLSLQDQDNRFGAAGVFVVEADLVALQKGVPSPWRFVRLKLTGGQKQFGGAPHRPGAAGR